MQISDNDLEEFRTIYKDEFGEELSIGDAREMASNLLDLYELLMQPLPEELDPPAENSLPDPATHSPS